MLTAPQAEKDAAVKEMLPGMLRALGNLSRRRDEANGGEAHPLAPLVRVEDGYGNTLKRAKPFIETTKKRRNAS